MSWPQSCRIQTRRLERQEGYPRRLGSEWKRPSPGAPGRRRRGEARKGKVGPREQRRWREGGRRRTSRGFGRRGLCLPLRSGKDGSREEAPEEERDAEHLDHDAAGSEGPGAQPHRAHPPRRDPDSRAPGHFSPRSRGSRLHRRRAGEIPGAQQSPCVLSASAVAPEIRTRGQPLQERRPRAQTVLPVRSKLMLWKRCAQRASKCGELSSAHSVGKGQFSSKKGYAKECSNYRTIALISHAGKVMLKNPSS